MRLILLLGALATAATAQYIVNDLLIDENYDLAADYMVNVDAPSAARPQIHAVLVAGSSGYGNYRHQSDICHAYQLLSRNGVPDENIVVMMVDDIAYDPENPTPGVIINRPNGSDVYHGVPKDYTGKDVTPEVFLKVLLGDTEGLRGIGSGKVLNSGPNDHVFINFADHGAPGLVAFPESELHARDLERVLKQMHQQRRYKRLVFYLEACESGSMFEQLLPPNMGIFATTAANGEESSYAVYYDAERRTYLGDVYSVNWMEDSDQEDLSKETLQRQYALVKKETNTSHVMEYGDRTFRNLPVGDFLGETDAFDRIVYEPVHFDPVDSRDVPRLLLEKRLEVAATLDERKEVKRKLTRLHKMRKLVTQQFMRIIDELTGGDVQARTRLLKTHVPLKSFACYEPVTKYYSKNCLSIARNPYTMSKLYLFVNLCEEGWRAEAIIEAMAGVCGEFPEMVGIE